jgi:glycosyltransferase involved in cell wall biosynthesis
MKNTYPTKKVALYTPYLDVLGGGEKHILSIIKIFEDFGFTPYVFWDTNLKKKIKRILGLNFKNLFFLPNIFKKKSTLSFFKNLFVLKKFDYFFYVTDGSYFFSLAKKNFVFAMVPDKNLYQLNLVNRLKLLNWQFIANSSFTSFWLKKWGINAWVITPYIDEKLFKLNRQKKEKIILSVGRFFSHLHSKKQDIIIKTFKKIKQKNSLFKNFKLILAGGLKEKDKDYFNYLQKITADNCLVIFKPNISQKELHRLYQKATFFWHFAGYGVDEEKYPQNVEHLGITPLEAMAAGCLTFCYKAGGPRNLIKDGLNGFLFNSEKELIRKMENVIFDKRMQKNIKKNAYDFVFKNFSYEVFKEKVKKLIISI